MCFLFYSYVRNSFAVHEDCDDDHVGGCEFYLNIFISFLFRLNSRVAFIKWLANLISKAYIHIIFVRLYFKKIRFKKDAALSFREC